jgi:hypothetical protein
MLESIIQRISPRRKQNLKRKLYLKMKISKRAGGIPALTLCSPNTNLSQSAKSS